MSVTCLDRCSWRQFQRLMDLYVAQALVISLIVAGCDRPGSPPSSLNIDDSRRQYAVFHDRALVIARLEAPTKVMLAGVASPQTLVSDDPAIVSVNADGDLVAHRFGNTLVRSIPNPNSILAVEVRQIRSIQLDPPVVRIRVGESSEVRLSANGRPVDAASADWSSDDLAVARIDRQIVRANARTGVTTVRARVGDAEAAATVLVVDNTLPKMRSPSTIKKGSIGHVELSPAPLQQVEWLTSRPRVLKPLGSGFFEALTLGQSTVCARVDGRQQCSTIEVIR